EPYGTFRLGGRYGEVQRAERVDWSSPRARRAARLAERGFAEVGAGRSADVAARRDAARSEAVGSEAVGSETTGERPQWKRLAAPGARRSAAASRTGSSAVTVQAPSKGGPGHGATQSIRVETAPLTHVAVTAAGVQRISYEALRDGGLDLAGVPAGQIAVTWRGEPVERWIDGPGAFGPGSAIEFVGRSPAGDDALYVDAALYQVSVDPSRARPAKSIGRAAASRTSPSYRRTTTVDRQVTFHNQSPTGDPWIERSLLVRRAATLTLDLPVAGPVLPGEATLFVGLGTVSDLPDLLGADGQPLPEHNVEVWLAPPGGDFSWVADASTSGQQDWRIEAVLPSGLLQAGTNRVQLRFTSPYFFSLVLVDRYGVEHPAPYLGPTLDFAPDPAARGYLVSGFSGPGVVVYAEGADGGLTRIEPRTSAAGGGWAAEIRAWAAERYWVTERPHAPAVFTTAAPPDLLAAPADLVVIAGSSFVGTAALDAYLAQTADFDPLVVDVEDVYNAVGYGMALPGAITDYLAARHAVHPFTHVQLVGTDCYDRFNRMSSCISHLPLPTAAVGPTLYSPSQNRLVDLDGDGVGDAAVGQFSVRDESELATIVAKGASWHTSGLSAARSALFVAEETDGTHSFDEQVGRLGARLGWSDTEVLDLAAHPSIVTARAALKSSLDSGRALTVFSGHSSPSVWAFRSLLTAGSVATLANAGKPTLMVPLACETTYDVSPSANVLGHQLLYGGDRGALAVSGAAALSSLADNERMARHVLDGLDAGLTLGEAVLAGRRALGSQLQELQDNWVTQGDVTTRLSH
ncbi:MAG TPA: C25 family cysteine peptidase, partial [Thermoanaerobaculia bacterium]